MQTPAGPILVVEDFPNILQMLEITLRFKGYAVITARNGQEALELIAAQRPALVVTDILMPKMDGFSLVYQLRSHPETSRIPVIFLSATYVTPEDKEFALRLGAVRFLEKPVETEEFLLTVGEVLTMLPQELPPPVREQEFMREYRDRLEVKLRHKNAQIFRTERLLETLPEEQKPAFQSLLQEVLQHRDEIQGELDDLYQLLRENSLFHRN
jgi:CheY-like chemotaxis protein